MIGGGNALHTHRRAGRLRTHASIKGQSNPIKDNFKPTCNDGGLTPMVSNRNPLPTSGAKDYGVLMRTNSGK